MDEYTRQDRSPGRVRRQDVAAKVRDCNLHPVNGWVAANASRAQSDE
jgi:hypothetical protein